MIDRQDLPQPSRKRQIAGSLVFTAIACLAAIYLAGSAGPVIRYLHLELDFLVMPLVGFFILRFFSRLIGILIPSQSGTGAALVLNAAAVSFFTFVILSRASLFARIPALAASPEVLADVADLAPYSIMFFIGYTVAKFSELLTSTSLERKAAPAVKTLGLILIVFFLWRVPALFTEYWSSAEKLGTVLFSGLLAIAVSNLGAYGQKSENRLIADISIWLKSSSTGKFFLGAFTAAYIVFIQPVIEVVSPYAHLITWLLVCFIAFRLFSNSRKVLQQRYCGAETEAGWEKHVQQVDDRRDEDYLRITLLQSNFVEENDKDILLIYLEQTLRNNKLSEDETARLLLPLTWYQDRKVPWYAFGYWRKRIQKQNRQNRKRTLEALVKELGAIR